MFTANDVLNIGMWSILFSKFIPIKCVYWGLSMSPLYMSILGGYGLTFGLYKEDWLTWISNYIYGVHPDEKVEVSWLTSNFDPSTVITREFDFFENNPRILTNLALRNSMIEISRSNEDFQVEWYVRHKLELKEYMIHHPRYFVGDDEYLEDFIFNPAEKRTILEEMELERITWQDPTYENYQEWHRVNDFNYIIRFEEACIADAELVAEEDRDVHDMGVVMYHWTFCKMGKYFLP